MALVQSQKIVLVINSLQGGGAEKFVLTLGEAFYQMGYEVHIVRFDPIVEHTLSENLIYHLIPFRNYRRLPKGKIRHFFFARAVDGYINKHIGQPVAIFVNLYREHEVFYYSRQKKVAYVIHNQLSEKLKLATLPPKQLSYFQRIYTKYPAICVSGGVQQDFVRQFGEPTKTTTIDNPIDRDNIRVLAEAANPDLPAITRQGYLIHVGSFKAQKGHEILLQAYANSAQTLPLVLVGKGSLQAQIEQKIIALNLQDKVILTGFQKNPYPLLKHTTGFVLSSHFEGFALVLAESLALGVPAISTDCPSGPSEILPPQNLVAVADIPALTEKINQLMSHPSQFNVPFNEAFLPQNVARQYLTFMGVGFE